MFRTNLLLWAIVGWVLVAYFIVQIRKAVRTGELDIGWQGNTRIITRSTHPLEFPMWIYFMSGCTFLFGLLDVVCMLGAFGVIE